MNKKMKRVLEACHELLADFDMWGEVLQCGPDDEDGEYGPSSSIEKLCAAIAAAEGRE